MIIQKKLVRSLREDFAFVRPNTTVVIGVSLEDLHAELLQKIGIPPDAHTGYTFVPPNIGPFATFNIKGGVTPILQKSKRQGINWSALALTGDYAEKNSNSNVENLIAADQALPPPNSPPGVELRIAVSRGSKRMLVAPPVDFTTDNEPLLLHIVNLYLELFGYCAILNDDLEEITAVPIRKLYWKILPSGKREWGELYPYIEAVICEAPEPKRVAIERRFEIINEYGPDFVAIGQDGFDGYIVFGFVLRRLFLFECVRTGNATYVFGDDWENLSKLTKTQILENRLHLARIIHRGEWPNHIHQLLKQR